MPPLGGNLQIDLPAGTPLQTGGPSATAGFTRVAAQAVYFDANAGRCSVNGVAIPA